jgi:UDP-N-acetylmuramoyl-tripeptide--D-alanyl-D-alanine ligase
VEGLPTEGTAILNVDDLLVRGMAERSRARVMTYGVSESAGIRGSAISSQWPDRLALTVAHEGTAVRIETQLVGEHWVTSVLAAVACGIACGLDLETCAAAVKSVEPAFGRYSVHQRPGPKGSVLDNPIKPAVCCLCPRSPQNNPIRHHLGLFRRRRGAVSARRPRQS